MSDICDALHRLLARQPRYYYPFEQHHLPSNGVCVFFEKGETGHEGDRIVRVGTHYGDGNLVARLNEHFIKENKDRSVFRKTIGKALLARDKDPFLAQWSIDRTNKAVRDDPARQVDLRRLQQVERKVTQRIQEYFSFVIIPVPQNQDRHALEAMLVGTVAHCSDCRPSSSWFGLHSPNEKIRESGLWQVQHLDHEPMTAVDLELVHRLLSGSKS